jgi:hypothetical protein
VNLVLDLHRQLARRREDQDAALSRQAALGFRGHVLLMIQEQPLERGDDECRGLAGAGLRASNQVLVGQRERDDGRLNGTGILPAEIARTFQQSVIEAERRKGNRRRVDIDRVEQRDAGRRCRAG